MTDPSLADQMYLRLKTLWTGKTATLRKRRQEVVGSEAFTPGRDPLSISSALDTVTQNLGWDKTLADAELVSDWASTVGPETAANTVVEKFDDGILTVRCASTAWATQLQFISSEVLTKLTVAHPRADLRKIQFIGPNAPSWKRGPRTIPGRGARDTYG